MKKILVIGSKGMAGHVILSYLKENTNFEIVDIARGNEVFAPTHQLDITDFRLLAHVLKTESPDYVINCIGILNKDAEDHPDKSILLNGYLPHYLARLGKENNFKLIHISTDCVFNGRKGGYTEDSQKDGEGFYAETKALGEVVYGNNLTIRTSIIGPELKSQGIGLFHWFMQQEGSIKGYTRAYWTGITTVELARVILTAIQEGASGLHHIVNGDKISKFELIQLFKLTFSKNVQIEPFDGYQIDKSLIRTNKSFNYSVPTYISMVQEMKTWIENHSSFYQSYI